MPLPLILAGMAVEELVVWGLGLLATSYVAANAAKDSVQNSRKRGQSKEGSQRWMNP
ncbi:hypothetical protein KME70_10855 [Ralstonia solanacearum]|nr:hypothetical protein KME70_10855 [Ralstonia solanacearum]